MDSVSTKGWWLIVDGDGVCDDDDDDDGGGGGGGDDDDDGGDDDDDDGGSDDDDDDDDDGGGDDDDDGGGDDDDGGGDDDDDDDGDDDDDDDDDGMGDTVARIAWKSLYVLYDQNLGREYPIRINKKRRHCQLAIPMNQTTVQTLVDVSITAFAKLWSPLLTSRHLLKELSQRRHSFRP